MNKIRLIEKKDIETLTYKKMNWDVVVREIPYQIIKVKGFPHTIGGNLDWGEGNDFWAYPLNEPLTYENLVEFNGVPGVCWGIEYSSPTTYIRAKYGEKEILSGRKLVITRNGKPFYDGFITFHQAIAYVSDGILDEHPLNLNERDFDKKCIGRKIWWRSQPGIITRYIHGQACVIIKPDGLASFHTPAEFASEDIMDDNDSIKTDIFDNHIWWFREGNEG